MDWKDCLKKGLAAASSLEPSALPSLLHIAEEEADAAFSLDSHPHAKIALLYEALRIRLDCLAMEKGFRILNPACYTSFLRDILRKPQSAQVFDGLRKTRDRIIASGTRLSKEQAGHTLLLLARLFEECAPKRF